MYRFAEQSMETRKLPPLVSGARPLVGHALQILEGILTPVGRRCVLPHGDGAVFDRLNARRARITTGMPAGRRILMLINTSLQQSRTTIGAACDQADILDVDRLSVHNPVGPQGISTGGSSIGRTVGAGAARVGEVIQPPVTTCNLLRAPMAAGTLSPRAAFSSVRPATRRNLSR
jgi:hypothetical protein